MVFSTDDIHRAWDHLTEPLTQQRSADSRVKPIMVIKGYTMKSAAALVATKIGCSLEKALLGKPAHIRGSSYVLKPCRLCDRRVQHIFFMNKKYNLDFKEKIVQPNAYIRDQNIKFLTKLRTNMNRRTRLRTRPYDEITIFKQEQTLLEVFHFFQYLFVALKLF